MIESQRLDKNRKAGRSITFQPRGIVVDLVSSNVRTVDVILLMPDIVAANVPTSSTLSTITSAYCVRDKSSTLHRG